MTRKLFGTDGIRGTANTHPMTPEIALKVAMAAGRQFIGQRSGHRPLAVIGKDTRLSGYMLEPALTAGFIAIGMDVVLVGPMPTPAVAMLTRSFRADLGVVISASHNPFEDNGIKLFGPDGFKLSDEVELEIERRIEIGPEMYLAEPAKLGRARRLEDAGGRYIEFVKNTFPRGSRLDGLRIVVDCAQGAAYKVAPRVLFELGADVIPIGVEPNGFNINDKCGATAPQAMRDAVLQHKADLGIALDGDADRLIVCDEKGQIIDGDQVMALIASFWHANALLKGGGVVATVMSNLGLERYLAGLGLALVRTSVGDRYVVERMRAEGYNLGGEQSGHIVMSDYATTGDGLIAALQVLAVLVESARPLSEVARVFTPLPQVLKNVRYGTGAPLEEKPVRDAVAAGEAELAGQGRLLIRKSGTESVIRVMAEGEDAALINRIVDDIVAAVRETAGQKVVG
ncbi:phosphoglucosamine mutase [Oceanibaculum indicum]|uniref:Phosphoglucosamine mutase n=1 Tax=Oceanibaculum indicum TaxID=526216 RepID=A0A420WB34_9PROT|nr:phosphoglucosamine mutase [Oceanibaculum indicum]RKQ68176.1 phosphoglucosamine mutase [Oceanibaculum indicum]